VLDEPGDLRFSPEMNLPICSANEWYEIFTSMLKVQLEDVSLNDLLCGEWTLSEKASVLITL
jgi:hypothetical protein